MAVSNYIRGCEYSVNRLDKVVYLFSDSMTKDIRVDNGAAYVTLASSPIAYEVNSIEIEDTSSLDERYEFSHRVSFSVNGYANDDFIGEKYYVAVKTVGGAYYILNPRIPCRVQYTFTLGKDECHTDFVMDTVSNDATLPLNISSLPSPKTCGYYLDGLKSIKLNEAMYSKRDGNVVCYTNDGFKDIDLGMDAVFTESFDGEVMTHSISFTIPMTVYKQSWYYNLLEFNANTYSALIESKSGRVYASGFGYGLQPSYTMNGNSTDSAYISVRLECIYDSQTARYIATSMDDLEIGECEGYSWVYTDEYGGYECVGDGIAMYLLKKELNELGLETGNYKCKRGYETLFEYLNIVGTFDEVQTYINPDCDIFVPQTGGTLPSRLELDYSGQCKNYTFSSNCDWNVSIASGQNDISITPMSGASGILYTVTICNGMYRWVNSGYTCEGYDKYNVEVQEKSLDGGTTWVPTSNTRRGSLIESDSVDCGWVSPCVIEEISCTPTSAIVSTSVTSVTTVVTVDPANSYCNSTWVATIESPSSPSGTLIVTGHSGDSLEVTRAQSVTISSIEDSSKTCVFNVVREAEPFNFCVSAASTCYLYDANHNSAVGKQVCLENPVICDVTQTKTDSSSDYSLTLHVKPSGASIVSLDSIRIGGELLGNITGLTTNRYKGKSNDYGSIMAAVDYSGGYHYNIVMQGDKSLRYLQIDFYIKLKNGEEVKVNNTFELIE